ncbi:glycosyltransferase family 2 protein [Falsiroseomonas oryziterrae]|uniref:glycosyltransferase family 2 protein n=1 Tax=Falsiroseomonas oryziterrae TaxID=2911368 RepID=UPI001F31125B|nr:glycosyltransferase family 2 protein [Roseomonas sp. NPKOSM-4]
MTTATIVIPCYNALAYLDDAVASALAQTVRDIEVIAVDDHSTDATLDHLRWWAARDPRLTVLQTAANGGPAVACNTAYARATGRWVTVLDSDDLFLPERIERLAAFGEARGADMVADNLLERCFDTGRDIGLHFPEAEMRHEGWITLAEMLRRDMPDLPGKSRLGFVQPMIRRDLLERHKLRFPTRIRAGEDFVHYFECVAHGARFALRPEAWYIYRIREGSITYRPSSTYHYPVANRHLMEVVRRLGITGEVPAMLARRQALVDFNCLAQAALDGQFLRSLSYFRLGTLGGMWRQARTVAGALRRRVQAKVPAGDARAASSPSPARSR